MSYNGERHWILWRKCPFRICGSYTFLSTWPWHIYEVDHANRLLLFFLFFFVCAPICGRGHEFAERYCLEVWIRVSWLRQALTLFPQAQADITATTMAPTHACLLIIPTMHLPFAHKSHTQEPLSRKKKIDSEGDPFRGCLHGWLLAIELLLLACHYASNDFFQELHCTDWEQRRKIACDLIQGNLITSIF